MSLLLATLFACAAPQGAGAADDSAIPDAATVQGTFVLLDARSGEPRGSGVTAETADGQVVEAGAEGATVSLAPGPFAVVATANDSSPHRLVGVAGDADFTLYSYMADRTLTGQVMGLLGRAADPAKGFLVVALDHPDLTPATGASATIDARYDTAFVLKSTGVEETTQVVPGAGGFVTFANVAPGPVDITVTPPDGEACGVFPAMVDDVDVGVIADTVTVVTWHCEAAAE